MKIINSRLHYVGQTEGYVVYHDASGLTVHIPVGMVEYDHQPELVVSISAPLDSTTPGRQYYIDATPTHGSDPDA